MVSYFKNVYLSVDANVIDDGNGGRGEGAYKLIIYCKELEPLLDKFGNKFGNWMPMPWIVE